MRVIVASNRNGDYRSYHTNPDCQKLDEIKNVHRRKMEALPDNVTECEYCSGEWNDKIQGEQGPQLAAKLENMDPEEIDL